MARQNCRAIGGKPRRPKVERTSRKRGEVGASRRATFCVSQPRNARKLLRGHGIASGVIHENGRRGESAYADWRCRERTTDSNKFGRRPSRHHHPSDSAALSDTKITRTDTKVGIGDSGLGSGDSGLGMKTLREMSCRLLDASWPFCDCAVATEGSVVGTS